MRFTHAVFLKYYTPKLPNSQCYTPKKGKREEEKRTHAKQPLEDSKKRKRQLNSPRISNVFILVVRA